jgi:hypothetical protein
MVKKVNFRLGDDEEKEGRMINVAFPSILTAARDRRSERSAQHIIEEPYAGYSDARGA